MTLDEYKERKDEIEREAEVKKINLAKEYAYSNSNIVKGDMVTDHIGTVKVDRIGVYLDFRKPSCIYHGYCYTKAGKPFKRGERRGVYQDNVVGG